MVEVSAFKGVFYKEGVVGGIDKVISPPYDIIPSSMQDMLYDTSEYNIVRLILNNERPEDNGDNKYTRASKKFEKWVDDGVLVQDPNDGIYVYQEEFEIEGVVKKQSGFICLVKLEPFENRVILPHEKVHDKVIKDRYKLLTATQASLEAIMSLYSDPSKKLDTIRDSVMESDPMINVGSGDGVIHRVWAIHDKKILSEIIRILSDQNIYIADGHHRYNTALRYHLDNGGGNGSSKYIMMSLLSMDDDLTLYSAHRMLRGFKGLDLEKILPKLETCFKIKKLSSYDELLKELNKHNGSNTFGLLTKEEYILLKVKKDGCIKEYLAPDKADVLNELDVTILHDVIIKQFFGVKDLKGVKTGFERSSAEVFDKIDSGKYQIAFLLNSPTVDQVKHIADADEVMPRKSTYFYPKLYSGLVIYKF